MWFSLSEQTAYFLWSIVLGAAAGALYDILRAVRAFFNTRKLPVIVSDILFFAACGILTSLFALPFNKGNVRGFIVFGEAVGFLCFYLTLGRILSKFYSILSKGIKRFLKKICELLKKFFDFLLKTTAFVVYNVCVLIDKLIKKLSAGRKKAIHHSRTVRKNSSRSDGKKHHLRRRTDNRKRNGYERRYKKEKKKPRKRKRR